MIDGRCHYKFFYLKYIFPIFICNIYFQYFMQLRSPENISCFGHDHPYHVVPSIGDVSKCNTMKNQTETMPKRKYKQVRDIEITDKETKTLTDRHNWQRKKSNNYINILVKLPFIVWIYPVNARIFPSKYSCRYNQVFFSQFISIDIKQKNKRWCKIDRMSGLGGRPATECRI